MSFSILVLISGNGSNLQAIIDACDQQMITGNVVAVISNQAKAFGLRRAKKANIPTHIVNHTAFSSREDYDNALIQLIDKYRPNLVVLAGFMRILTPNFVAHYQSKLINIHPSLLPKYKGLNTHQRAIEAKDDEHGCTVHFVINELDAGEIVMQARVPILPTDDAKSLAKRVQQKEHEIYPLAIAQLAKKMLS